MLFRSDPRIPMSMKVSTMAKGLFILNLMMKVAANIYAPTVMILSWLKLSSPVEFHIRVYSKASGSSFIDSTPDGFVITDFDGNLVEGEGKPTREALLHGLLYRICPKVNAVVHTHSPYSIAWASTGKALKRTTWHAQLKMSADLPSLDVPAAMVKKEYFPMVEDIYRENPDLPGFLLVDHEIGRASCRERV